MSKLLSLHACPYLVFFLAELMKAFFVGIETSLRPIETGIIVVVVVIAIVSVHKDPFMAITAIGIATIHAFKLFPILDTPFEIENVHKFWVLTYVDHTHIESPC